MNYLDLWIANLRQRNSVHLTRAITVVGHREKHFGPRSEFARVAMTISPAEELDVVDNVPWRKELEALGVAWPQCVVFGLLDVVMFAEFGSLHNQNHVGSESRWTMLHTTILTVRRTPSARQAGMQDAKLSKW
jgi:hypothetical protein